MTFNHTFQQQNEEHYYEKSCTASFFTPDINLTSNIKNRIYKQAIKHKKFSYLSWKLKTKNYTIKS